MPKIYKTGNDFTIVNYRELTDNSTTTVPQVPFSLNNPSPNPLRGADIPGAPYSGKKFSRAEGVTMETNNILAENGDALITESGDNLIIE